MSPGSAGFPFLMRQTGLTAGNLSSHTSKLEAAVYIEVVKEFVDRKPHTMLRLTDAGMGGGFSGVSEGMLQVLRWSA